MLLYYEGILACPQEGVCNWCGQLGGGGSERGLLILSSLALIRSPEKNPLQTSGGIFCGLVCLYGVERATVGSCDIS